MRNQILYEFCVLYVLLSCLFALHWARTHAARRLYAAHAPRAVPPHARRRAARGARRRRPGQCRSAVPRRCRPFTARRYHHHPATPRVRKRVPTAARCRAAACTWLPAARGRAAAPTTCRRRLPPAAFFAAPPFCPLPQFYHSCPDRAAPSTFLRPPRCISYRRVPTFLPPPRWPPTHLPGGLRRALPPSYLPIPHLPRAGCSPISPRRDVYQAGMTYR